MSILNDFTDDFLQAAHDAHTYRTMRHICTPEASHVEIAVSTQNPIENARGIFLLASNSYLDLCNEPELKQAAAEAVLKWGTGSGGARLTTGNKTPHEELEKALAHFKGEEAAITFATGYMANVGTISALANKQVFKAGSKNAAGEIRSSDEQSECIVFSDELNHASIIDGIRLSKARCYVYKHNDMANLQHVIEDARSELTSEQLTTTRFLIVTDAVFSMDGDLANLPELQKIAKANHCLLMIDEAHSTGVLGKTGRGLAEHFNDKGISCEHADVTLGTMSKAIGCEGGFVVGSRQLIEFLKNKARSFIFSTSMSPAMAQATCNNLKFIEKHPERVQQLQENVRFFCEALVKAGIHLGELGLDSAIVPIIIGDEAKALAASAALQEKGILIPAIRYPTVAKGQARLRASLMATHTQEDLLYAATCIAEVLNTNH